PTITVTRKATGGQNEKQTVLIKATSGTYSLGFDKNSDGDVDPTTEVTGPVAFDALGTGTASLQAALVTLLGAGSVTVVKEAAVAGDAYSRYTITFSGTTYGAKNVPELKVADTSNLVGGERSFFIKTGPNGTTVDAHASANAEHVNFEAKLGPFGLFVADGAASVGGNISVKLIDANGTGRLVLVGYGDGSVMSDLGRIGAFLGLSAASVSTLQDGSGSQDEIQALTVNAKAPFTGQPNTGKFRLQLGSSGPMTADIVTDASLTAASLKSALLPLVGSKASNVEVTKSGLTFFIRFTGDETKKDEQQLEVVQSSAGPLALTVDKRIITFTGAATLPPPPAATPDYCAVTAAGAPFACLRLPITVGTQDFQIPIDFGDQTPGVDNDCLLPAPANCDGIRVSTTREGDGTLQEIQVVVVTATKGKYKLKRTATAASDDLDYNALDTAVASKLTTLYGASVTVTRTTGSGTTGPFTYEIKFDTSLGNVAQMTFDNSDLGDGDNILAASAAIDLDKILSGQPGGFAYTFKLPHWNQFKFELPSLFAMLSDPSVIVDGIDHVLGAIQDVLRGQLFGTKLPLVGDALANNPVSNVINDFRVKFLKPLANTIRQNNLNLEGLQKLIRKSVFDLFNGIGLLADLNGDGVISCGDPSAPGPFVCPDVKFQLYDKNHVATASIFNANSAQIDFALAKTFTFTADRIKFDLGIDALGISADFQPQITLDFNLLFGFGVDGDKGFYFVADHKDSIGNNLPELSLNMVATFSKVCSGNLDRASVEGRLLFLALHLTDGVDMNGNGKIDSSCVNGHPNPMVSPQTEELTKLYFGGSIDVKEPSGDGLLTISEIVSSPLSKIFEPHISGGGIFRAEGVVDFSALGGDLANILPSVKAKILIDFPLSWTPGQPFTVLPPQVVLGDITLDLGSFISKFAKPILDKVAAILDPLAWLIGPDGFLNKRIPLLSDLAGHTITGKDLVVMFDPEDGPKIVAFLNFVQELYYLIKLVRDAGNEGNVGLNFGDLILFEAPANKRCGSTITPVPDPHACYPNLGKVKFVDHRIDFGAAMPGGNGDLRNLHSFNNINLANLNLPPPSTEGAMGKSTSSFTKGVTKPGAIYFKLLEPGTIFKLLLGQPADIVIVQLPEFGFNFLYRQQFPIIGPLVGTFAGGVGATVSLAFGYDTLGLQQFMASHNPVSLLNGFFISDVDPVTGVDRPEVTLHAEIAVGAAISLGFASAGAEGGISATILFNFADLDGDGKIRFDELKSNVLANGGNPLAVFDISGVLEFFLRAYVEINLGFFSFKQTFEFVRLKLLQFNVEFKRPSVLATQSGDVLTLAIGPNSANRLRGDLNDVSEHIFVSGSGGTVNVWSPQFNRESDNAQTFTGVKKIVGDGGLGDDFIDASGLTGNSVALEVHGGDGNDVIIGGGGDDHLFGDAGNDILKGGDGADVIDGGDGNDIIEGGPGNNMVPDDPSTTDINETAAGLIGGPGNDTITGGTGNDIIDGGTGDDAINGGGGSDTYLGLTAASFNTITGPTPTLDFTGRPENLSFILKNGKLLVGWGDQSTPVASASPADDAAIAAGAKLFAHMVYASNVSYVTHLIGGSGADLFDVYRTSTAQMTLDGGKGNDTFVFHSGSDTINALVDDQGNPWDSNNQIVIDGKNSTTSPDAIVVTNAHVCMGPCATQQVQYASPAEDAEIVRIVVNGNDGDDSITVETTSKTVPVRIDAGRGSDVITVGNGSLSGLLGMYRPGVNTPFGFGPLVIAGSPRNNTGTYDDSGIDTVVVNDQSDTTARSGYLTAFWESRPSIGDDNLCPSTKCDGFVEVGVVGGLGMQLYKDITAASADAGRVEYEGIEAATVLLGTNADDFTVGGEGDLLLGNVALPQARQEHVQQFVHTTRTMTSIRAGAGNDILRVLSTQDIDRDGLNTRLGLLSAAALSGAGPWTQVLTVNGDTQGNGFFTLKFRYQETKPIPFDATAADIQDALQSLQLLGSKATVASTGSHQFTVTFTDLATVVALSAKVIPLLIDGGDNNDDFRVASLYEETFIKGGSEDGSSTGAFPGGTNGDVITLNAYADGSSGSTPVPFTIVDVNPHIALATTQEGDATHNEQQTVTLTDVTHGTFTLTFGANTTTPIAWDAPANAVDATLEALDGDPDPTKDDFGVVKNANAYTIEFHGVNEHVNVAPLTFSLTGLKSNGIHATVTVDGEGGNDAYTVYLIGGTTASLINVFDSGTSALTSQLPPAGTSKADSDTLTVLGTEQPDFFLLRAATAETALAFIAMINGATDPHAVTASTPVERINYNNNLELIDLQTLGGDDQVYVDDTRAKILIEGGEGKDFFQVGQLYKSRRTPPTTWPRCRSTAATATTPSWSRRSPSPVRRRTRAG
ncbi:MAG: hypothetical protein AUG84_02425, partial [Chloroflexi bacterium 13_1_20CM_4_66_7]